MSATTVLADNTSKHLTADPHLALRVWLWVVAGLIVVMIAVGGATRLTDSGLSIVEWRPVTGVIPPLTEAQWQAELEKYRQIPEYQLINRGMSLDEFKVIYWWEWGHRFLGRIIGLAFFVPLVWFWVRRRIPDGMKPRLVGLFLLGGLQGAIGWWMVASGLVDRVDVSQYRLAVHLGMAFLILGAIYWTIRDLAPARSGGGGPPSIAWQAGGLTALVFLQIMIGALVAGLDAGLGYPTWPLMDGRFIPNHLFIQEPWHINLFENALTVQFNHRMLAYLLLGLAVVHMLWLWRAEAGRAITRRAGLIVAALVVQAGLGIATLLTGVPVWLALLHQFGAVIVLLLAIEHWRAALVAPRLVVASA